MPPERPVCEAADPAASIEALARILEADPDDFLRGCAAQDLARRGEVAVPPLVAMLVRGDAGARILALGALAKIGPQAQKGLPALMHLVKTPALLPPHAAGLPYAAIGAIGAGAMPAIPLLIEKTHDRARRHDAVAALGKLGKYDAARVVPHLIRLLESQEIAGRRRDANAALGAFADIGKPAHAALPLVLVMLDESKRLESEVSEWTAIYALVAIAEPGESTPILVALLDHPKPNMQIHAANGFKQSGAQAASAVPAMLDKLVRSRDDFTMRQMMPGALAAVAPDSPAVQQQLLVEATQHDNEHAAGALANITPLPARFAAPLAAALAKKPNDPWLARALRNAQQAR